jgi:hypothetical protein
MRRGRTALALGATAVLAGVGGAVWLGFLPFGADPAAGGAPGYVDEAATSGLAHTYDGDSRFFVGGGMATFDCDEDGRPDLYLAGGSTPAALFRNESAIGGALRFRPIHDAATDLVDVTGAYPLEIDGDGITDLAVLRAGENVLLRGIGGCRFERANEALGYDGGGARTMAFSATWEAAAALPTLAFGDYIVLDELGRPLPPCPDNELVRPAPDGDGYAVPLDLAPGHCPLSMLFSDWDRSGRRDLRISNDRQYYTDGEEQLWRIAAGEPPRLYTAADGWVTVRVFGMGIASQDVTGDGYPEVYLTSQADNKLQTLRDGPGRPTYEDIALRRGVTAARPFTGGDPLPSTAWHPEFADVNNDLLPDLFVSKGNVSAQVGYATNDPSELLLGRTDGTFVQGAAEAGIVGFDRGRGAALVDLNLDGLLDLVQVNLGAPVDLWRNVGSGDAHAPGPMGTWIEVRLEQAAPNRHAVGALVELRVGDATLTREITVGGGHISGQAGWIHFGLGDATAAEVRVTWPNGDIGPWQSLDADGFAIIERGAGAPRRWTPDD